MYKMTGEEEKQASKLADKFACINSYKQDKEQSPREAREELFASLTIREVELLCRYKGVNIRELAVILQIPLSPPDKPMRKFSPPIPFGAMFHCNRDGAFYEVDDKKKITALLFWRATMAK